MLKKLTILFLLSLYSFTSFGLSVNLFYCCGELEDVSLKFDTSKHADNCPKKETKKDCCKNKSFTIKISDDQINNGFIQHFLQQADNFTIIPVVFQLYQPDLTSDLFVHSWGSGIPPPRTKNRSILFSVFRI
ncbi:MAG TPA: hypothetical protein PK191_09465 [Niabella sp.]|nr:hypothetical protein [Niabella sp.]HOZ95563.1 hypothetical protein [Niabella sp.]HQW13803.1 hypothetical protein [Niabella sp.]HQX19304.1 hypothetical protein [Niabella sp.]HQX40840.1 hypothetical protein [Niabella sp.]